VLDIRDEHAMCVRIVTDQSQCWTTFFTIRPLVGSVRAHSSGAIVDCSVAVPQGSHFVDILNTTVREIIASVEAEPVQESHWRVIVDQLVWSGIR
jgi:hypothetical protein